MFNCFVHFIWCPRLLLLLSTLSCEPFSCTILHHSAATVYVLLHLPIRLSKESSVQIDSRKDFDSFFHEPSEVHPLCSTSSILIRYYYYYYHYYYYPCYYWMVSRWFIPTDMFQFWGMVSTRHLTGEELFWEFCFYVSRQFTWIHTSSTINIEKIWNRPITKFYNGGDVNVIAAELRLTKRSLLLFIRGIIFYKKQCQQM